MIFVFLHSKEHCQSYQLFVQLSHSSQISFIPFQHFLLHFSHRSTGHVKHVSPGSATQLPQFGFIGLYFVHMIVHWLDIFQLLLHSSHSSYSSFVLSQHLCVESKTLQYSEHFQSNQLYFQLSHCSHGSLIPLPHELVHIQTSFGQLLQSSAASTIQFQQTLVQFQTS
jgi:hypothetical protein